MTTTSMASNYKSKEFRTTGEYQIFSEAEDFEEEDQDDDDVEMIIQ